MSPRHMLRKVLDNYHRVFATTPPSLSEASRIMACARAEEVLRDAIPCCLAEDHLRISSGCGKGNATYAPWVGVFHDVACKDTVDDGYNVAYIFGWDQTRNRIDQVYLVLLMGAKTTGTDGCPLPKDEIARLAGELRDKARGLLRCLPSMTGTSLWTQFI